MVETTEEYRNRINQLKTDIINEPYMKEMRSDISEGIGKTGNRQADIEIRQDTLEDDFVAVQTDASNASPSGAEVAVARGSYPTLDQRLTTKEQEVNTQLAQTNNDIDSRGFNIQWYALDALDGNWTIALQKALDNHTDVFIPIGEFNVKGNVVLSRFGQSISGTYNKYSFSRLIFDTTDIAIKCLDSVGYLKLKNVKVENKVDILTDFFRSNTTGIELNLTTLEADGFMISNFETLFESVTGGYYHNFLNCRFEKFKVGFKNFSANNFNCYGSRFENFNDAFNITRDDGPFNISNSSFERFNGRIVATFYDGKRSVNFLNNYVEIYADSDIPTNFPNGEATGAKPGKYGGNTLFEGVFQDLVIEGNELQIDGVFRLINTTKQSESLSFKKNSLMLFNTGNNLDRTVNNMFNHYDVDNSLKVMDGVGGYNREYNQPSMSSLNPHDNSYFNDCVAGEILPNMTTLKNLELLDGWTGGEVTYGVPQAIIRENGLYLQGEVDGTNSTTQTILIIPEEFRPKSIRSDRSYVSFLALNRKTNELVSLRYIFQSGILMCEQTSASKNSINLNNIFIAPRF